MKKNLLYLFALICSVSVFTGCSDDDAPDYSGTYKGETLVLKLAGDTLEKKEVVINGAEIVLKNVILGEESTKIPVTFDGTTFKGSDAGENRTVSIEGSIENLIMTAEVTMKITSPIVGKWAISTEIDEDGSKHVTDGIYFDLDEDKTYDFFFSSYDPKTYAKEFNNTVGGILGGLLFDITLKEDGTIVATYNAGSPLDPSKTDIKESPANAVRYYIKDNQIYLVPNLEVLMSKSDNGINIGALLENGIPLNLNISGDDNFIAYVTKEQMAPFMVILKPMVENLPNDGMDGMAPLIKMIATEFFINFDKSEKFSLGLNMDRVK